MGQNSNQPPSRPQSAPRAYKSATPALNEKLQRYREDPEALAELQQRLRQHKTASRPASASPSFTRASADASNLHSSSATPRSSDKCGPRNFIEDNAANVTPWPCTGGLSTQAILTAQQSVAADCFDSSDDEYNTSSSGQGSPILSRPASAADIRQQTPALPVEQSGASSSNPCTYPRLQERPVSAGNRSPKAACSPRPDSAGTSICSSHSNIRRARSSHSIIPLSPSQRQDAIQEGTTSTLEQLGTQMAAKKEAAAARAAGVADRRAALAQAEQQRRLNLSSRSERLEAERLAAQQAGAAALLQLQQQELWSGVVVALNATSDLAALLQLQRWQRTAAVVIANAYKRYRIRKRHTEFVHLIVRMCRAIKPHLRGLLDSAHQRCAERVLLFLQRNTSSSMVLVAAHKFKLSVSLIQSHWRQVGLIRMSQENLLATAMKQLEQQLVARNTSAAAQLALAAELEGNLQQQGRLRQSRNYREGPAFGSRGVSGSGGLSSSGSRRSNGQVHILENGGTDVRARSGSDRSNSGSGQQQQQRAAPPAVTPYMRDGNTLFMPGEFFMQDEGSPSEEDGSAIPSPRAQRPGSSNPSSRPSTGGNSRGTSRPVSPGSAPVATALPHGPISPRGGYMTGQLSPQPQPQPARVQSSFTRNKDNNLHNGLARNDNSPQQGLATGGNGPTSRGLDRSAVSGRSPVGGDNRQGSTARANAAAAGGVAGSSVGWHADVVDLEVEARLRDLFVPLPNDLRRQVVRKHLNGLRRVLIAERETHAAAMKHYNKKLELEKLKQQLLKEAGVDAPITLLPPNPPRMKVLVPKDKLKLLIVEGMDTLHQQIVAARLAREDAAGIGRGSLDHVPGCNS